MSEEHNPRYSMADGSSPAEGGDPSEAWGYQPVEHHESFAQSSLAQNVLPLATSVLVHLVMIIIGLLAFGAAKQVTKVIQEQIIIPSAAIVEDAPVGGMTNPGLGNDPSIAAAQSEVQVQSE